MAQRASDPAASVTRTARDIGQHIRSIFQGFDLDEWLVRRFVWNEPVRPEYIPLPPIPGAATQKALRWVALTALLWIVVSTFACGAAARAIASMHVAPGNAALGFYTVVDVLAWMQLEWAHPQVASLLMHLYVSLGLDILFCATLALPVLGMKAAIPRKFLGLKPHTDWASLADYENAKLLGHSLPGVCVGAVLPPKIYGYQPRPRLLVYPGPRHIIVNATSRSGKDVMVVDFTEVATAGECSMVINSPKGEDYIKTSGVAKHFWGCNVYRFSPGSPEVGHVYRDSEGREHLEQFGCSPHSLYDEIDWGTDNEYWQHLQICTGIIAKTPKDLDGENGHWYRGSRVILKAVGTKVMYDPDETWKAVSRAADLLSGAKDVDSDEHDSLRKSSKDKPADTDSIHEIIEHYIGFTASGWGSTPAWMQRAIQEMRTRCEFDVRRKRADIGKSVSEADCFRWETERRKKLDRDIEHLGNQMRHPDLERDLRNIMRIRGDEAGSMYSTVNARLTVWLDPNVIRNTRSSSWTWTGIKNGPRPSRLWLVNPLDRADMYYDITRVELDFALRKLYPEMKVDFASKRSISPHDWPCIWLMNEIASIGEIPQLQTTIPVMASYNDIWVSLFQTPKQEREVFGENSVITPNSGVQLWHTPQEYDDAEGLSKSLGERMILSEDEQWNGMQRSRTVRADTVPLMTPAQVQMMPTEARWQENRDGKIIYDSTGSPVKPKRRAFQILRAPNMPPGYSMKLQSFYKGDFPAVHRLIRAYEPVLPDRTLIARNQVEIEAARLAATRDDVKSTTYQPETPLRTMARLSEAVRLQTLSAEEAAAVFAPRAAGATPNAAPASAANGGERPRRRVKRVLAMSDRVVKRDTSPEQVAANKQLPKSFEQFDS